MGVEFVEALFFFGPDGSISRCVLNGCLGDVVFEGVVDFLNLKSPKRAIDSAEGCVVIELVGA